MFYLQGSGGDFFLFTSLVLVSVHILFLIMFRISLFNCFWRQNANKNQRNGVQKAAIITLNSSHVYVNAYHLFTSITAISLHFLSSSFCVDAGHKQHTHSVDVHLHT